MHPQTNESLGIPFISPSGSGREKHSNGMQGKLSELFCLTSNAFQALSNQGVLFTADAEALAANSSPAREKGLGFEYKIMVLLARAKPVGSWRFGVTPDPLPQFLLSSSTQN